MRRAAKVDANQSEIVRGLQAMFGPDAVFDCSGVGHGFPDIMVGVRGVNILVELKTDRGRLTHDQVYFHREWLGQVVVAHTLDDVLREIARLTT